MYIYCSMRGKIMLLRNNNDNDDHDHRNVEIRINR